MSDEKTNNSLVEADLCSFSYDCNGTMAQNWANSGTTAVQVAGTNYCLDAGPCVYISDTIHVSELIEIP